jgi:hypothetical protein
MKTVVAIGLFFGWLAARFLESDYDKGYREGMKIGHLQGVVEGVDAGHLVGYDEGYKVGNADREMVYDTGMAEGYGEGFFAGVHKGFECKMMQIDESTFEC